MRELPFPLIKTRRINERAGSYTTAVHGMQQPATHKVERGAERGIEIATKNFIRPIEMGKITLPFSDVFHQKDDRIVRD